MFYNELFILTFFSLRMFVIEGMNYIFGYNTQIKKVIKTVLNEEKNIKQYEREKMYGQVFYLLQY